MKNQLIQIVVCSFFVFSSVFGFDNGQDDQKNESPSPMFESRHIIAAEDTFEEGCQVSNSSRAGSSEEECLFDHLPDELIQEIIANASFDSIINLAIAFPKVGNIIGLTQEQLKTLPQRLRAENARASRLMWAIQNRHSILLRQLNPNSEEVDEFFHFMLAPIHLATINGDIPSMEILLAKGANINQVDEMGHTPRDIAAINGDFSSATFIEANGGKFSPLFLKSVDTNSFQDLRILFATLRRDVSRTDASGRTVLHWAAHYGWLEAMQLLVMKGADFNRADANGQTALHIAACNSRCGIVLYLLTKGAAIDINRADANGQTALHIAARAALCATNDAEKLMAVMGYLIDHGANINQADRDGDTPLHMLARGLEDPKANVEINIGIMKVLIKNWGANPYKKNNAGQTAYDLIPQRFLSEYSWGFKYVKYAKDTQLYRAIQEGDYEEARSLIWNRCEINRVGRGKMTPLHLLATQPEQIELFKLLVDALWDQGENLNLFDCTGSTALHLAVESGNLAAAEYLIQAGAGLNVFARRRVSSFRPITALHLAIESGNLKAVQLLIRSGANLNVRSDYETPVDAAIRLNRADIVAELTLAGVNHQNLNSTNIPNMVDDNTIIIVETQEPLVDLPTQEEALEHVVPLNNITHTPETVDDHNDIIIEHEGDDIIVIETYDDGDVITTELLEQPINLPMGEEILRWVIPSNLRLGCTLM